MLKNKYLAPLLVLFGFQIGISQSVEIYGKVDSDVGVENINIINKTTYSYAITNTKGEFEILVKLNDTLQFYSMLHKTKKIVIDRRMLILKTVNVYLEEQVSELSEVTVGNRLSGDLLQDIKNRKGERPINFFDLGIPGYTGKIATQSERKLYTATTGDLDPIINAISGRTKMLKSRIALEGKEELMQSIKGRLSKYFFDSNPLEENLRMDFFYFCADDENFITYCKNETDFKILFFLRMKYKQYLENRNETED